MWATSKEPKFNVLKSILQQLFLAATKIAYFVRFFCIIFQQPKLGLK